MVLVETMLVEHRMVSPINYIDTVHGVRVWLHVTCCVLTTGGTMIV